MVYWNRTLSDSLQLRNYTGNLPDIRLDNELRACWSIAYHTRVDLEGTSRSVSAVLCSVVLDYQNR